MSDFKLDFSKTEYKGGKIAIVHARFNQPIINMMIDGVEQKLAELGVPAENVERFDVAGAYELPYATQQVAMNGGYDAVIAIGVVIRGDTPHFDYVCAESSRGLMDVSIKHNLPVIFGILTVNTDEQAEERANPNKMNKGGEAAATAIEMINLTRNLAN
ncbi:6,7-dimethyl-8-ribityllumazine synthase [Kangiella sediminilitoris]|uniref:6,7-dimethyl-8-ribityllumazine synthase n=1 Tax=Kangiella sediminilitoris TaxID=1144748 RepID=A0A1B3BD52_9GAMM|nr:6,7-dimethyl-8-ribityllumazine synthase [Kangiella sediminilitoris]AOE50657.1 6,7-dimethyl-8-ribityllumazine synthase [Kangiella sediminilitoris]